MDQPSLRSWLVRAFANARRKEQSFVLVRTAVLAAVAIIRLLAVRQAAAGPGFILWLFFAFYCVLWTALLLGIPRAARIVVAAGLPVDLFFLAAGLFLGGSAFVVPACLAAALYGFYFGFPFAPAAGITVALALAMGSFAAFGSLSLTSIILNGAVVLAFSLAFGWLGSGSKSDGSRPQNLDTHLRDDSNAAENEIQAKQTTPDNGNGSEPLGSVGRLSTEIAHQMRDPLNLMSLNLEMLQEELVRTNTVLKPEVADILSAMEKTVKSLSDISENCLQFARLPRPVMRPDNLIKLLDEILGATQPAFSRTGITCTTDLASEVPEIPFDRRQIRFALENIIQNAREVMPSGGRLRISLTAENGTVNVAIADTGSGIPAKLHRDIFEPFFSTKPLGTGLGLSLAKRIIEAHGGRLTVNSIVSVGSTFSVALPIHGRERA